MDEQMIRTFAEWDEVMHDPPPTQAQRESAMETNLHMSLQDGVMNAVGLGWTVEQFVEAAADAWDLLEVIES